MGTSGSVSLSLAMALERSLALSAHNLANATTAGYKSVQPLFESSPADTSDPGKSINFVQDKGTYLNVSQGALLQTDNPLDVAISGEGWFGFETTGGGSAYGRFGQLVVDVDGQMTSNGGRPILDTNGAPIILPNTAGQGISIAADGTITDDEGTILGQLGVFEVANPAALSPIGRGLFADPSGAVGFQPAENSKVAQGYIEASNVEPVLEMVRLIDIQRAYESSVKLMDEEHSLTKQAIQRLGRRV